VLYPVRVSGVDAGAQFTAYSVVLVAGHGIEYSSPGFR
jgi:hypothetical protein